MLKNDSTYLGEAEDTGLCFYSPLINNENEKDIGEYRWVKLGADNSAYATTLFKYLNDQRNLQLPGKSDLTSYENDDYLWLSLELETLRNTYNEAVANPKVKGLMEILKPIPYTQISLKSTAYSLKTRYPQSKLNKYEAKYKPHYVIEFQKPFMDAFMYFISGIFDDNPRIIPVGDGSKKIIKQFEAPIYRNSPFSKYFETRHDLPAIIFNAAIDMLLAHELAHVGCGHLDLHGQYPEYNKDPDIKIVEEVDADRFGITLILFFRFLQMEDKKIELTYNDIFQELTLTIFSVYMLFTWDYTREQRKWTNQTLSIYGKKGHLPYQLRAYDVLATSKIKLESLGKWCENEGIATSDSIVLDCLFMHEVFNEAVAMIDSFEKSYYKFYARTEDIYELISEKKISDVYEMMQMEDSEECELHKEQIPWKLGMEQDAIDEFSRVEMLRPNVIKKLKELGF